mmetsp:Transcript_1305/g.2946  ORF Transcript_1305/g.2946 Transcript_1305/m.2946 type:complete len:90 (-) Transcript_1305:473-742(-)
MCERLSPIPTMTQRCMAHSNNRCVRVEEHNVRKGMDAARTIPVERMILYNLAAAQENETEDRRACLLEKLLPLPPLSLCDGLDCVGDFA